MNMSKERINVNKRILGKRVIVISDHLKMNFWYGVVESVIDRSHFLVKNNEGVNEKVSIFDIRSLTDNIF